MNRPAAPALLRWAAPHELQAAEEKLMDTEADSTPGALCCALCRNYFWNVERLARHRRVAHALKTTKRNWSRLRRDRQRRARRLREQEARESPG